MNAFNAVFLSTFSKKGKSSLLHIQTKACFFLVHL